MKKGHVKKQLERIRLELQELIGEISIEELITNWRFTKRYEELHRKFLRAY
jgi:hypothetical protein